MTTLVQIGAAVDCAGCADTAERAADILDDDTAVLAMPGSAHDVALVFEDEYCFLVRWWWRGASCTCAAGRSLTDLQPGGVTACPHVVAALIVMADRPSARFAPEAGDQLMLVPLEAIAS